MDLLEHAGARLSVLLLALLLSLPILDGRIEILLHIHHFLNRVPPNLRLATRPKRSSKHFRIFPPNQLFLTTLDPLRHVKLGLFLRRREILMLDHLLALFNLDCQFFLLKARDPSLLSTTLLLLLL